MSITPVLDVEAIRRDFPALKRQVHGEYPLVYLDSAATTLKPQAVIDAVDTYYRDYPANIHRGLHALSEEATQAYEAARQKIAAFIGAGSPNEIVVTSGTTAGINLVAHSFGAQLGPGDEILISHLEHHSNIVPWQLLAERSGCALRVVPIDDSGALEMDAFHEMLGEQTRLVAMAHVSNSLGTVNPVSEITEAAHAVGAKVLLDGAQAVATLPVDVQSIDCDFYVFSGHKLFGPTGVGVLYGKEALLNELPPFLGGGDMIESVTFEKTTFNKVPHRFEAGTPNIAGLIGLGAAVDYVNGLGIEKIQAYEAELLAHATAKLDAIDGLRIIGTAPEKVAVLSMALDDVHPHDVGSILDASGVAVRAGHHCTQPVMARFGVPATTRASLSVYNSTEDIDALVAGLQTVKEIFG